MEIKFNLETEDTTTFNCEYQRPQLTGDAELIIRGKLNDDFWWERVEEDGGIRYKLITKLLRNSFKEG